MLPYIVTILGAYLIGCSNMSLYLSRWKGVNLRAGGSKNLGASNAFALMGWKAGLLVAVHDIGKAVLAVELSKWIFPAASLRAWRACWGICSRSISNSRAARALPRISA